MGEAHRGSRSCSSRRRGEAVEVEDPTALAYITQTTLSMEDTRPIVEALEAPIPAIEGPAKADICYATQNRQNAVRALARRGGGHLLVIGSKNSSNSNRLVEEAVLAALAGLPRGRCVGGRPGVARGSGHGRRRRPGRRPPSFSWTRSRPLNALGAEVVEDLVTVEEDVHFPFRRSFSKPVRGAGARRFRPSPRKHASVREPGRRLEGKVALVTGASRGIGEAISRRFGGDGARVALAARDEEACRRIAGRSTQREARRSRSAAT